MSEEATNGGLNEAPHEFPDRARATGTAPAPSAPEPPPAARTVADVPALPGALRVGLVSDTHGWLDPALLTHFRGMAAIVHAGDIGNPAVLDALAGVAPVTAVRGNIDSGRLHDLPAEAILEVAGRRIAVLHIAGPPRRPNATARRLVRRERPDLLIVGHSHMPVVARIGPDGAPREPGRVLPGETLWINPGAAGNHGFHNERTAAVLELPPGDEPPRLMRIRLGSRGRPR